MANPVMKAFTKTYTLEGEPMTINGTLDKTFISLLLVILAACCSWGLIPSGFTDKAALLSTVCVGFAFVVALIIIFTRKALNILVPLYAILEGLALGVISATFEQAYGGIVLQAVVLTLTTAASMLILYKSKLIEATSTFRKTIFIATISVAAVYLLQFIISFFGASIPQIFTNSPIGIVFSIVVCLIAALNLILDFDFIERGSQLLIPKEYEWYGAFGLMVTLIWLYLEILKLLAKSRSRN